MILSETYEKSSIESVISFLIRNPTPFLFSLFCHLYRNVCPLSDTSSPVPFHLTSDSPIMSHL